MEQIFEAVTRRLETGPAEKILLVKDHADMASGFHVHRHENFELRFVLGTKRSVEEIHIVFPEICHESLPEKLGPRTYVLYFADEGIFYRYGTGESGLFRSAYQECLIAFLDSLQDLSGRNATGWQQEFRYLLLLLHLSAEGFPEDQGKERRIPDMVQYIQTFYYRHSLNIQDLLVKFGCTSRDAQKFFRETTGIRPKEYLQQVRLNAAKKLLQEKRYSVKEVAALCGFADPHYFANRFKRFFCCTPSEKRRRAPEPGNRSA